MALPSTLDLLDLPSFALQRFMQIAVTSKHKPTTAAPTECAGVAPNRSTLGGGSDGGIGDGGSDGGDSGGNDGSGEIGGGDGEGGDGGGGDCGGGGGGGTNGEGGGPIGLDHSGSQYLGHRASIDVGTLFPDAICMKSPRSFAAQCSRTSSELLTKLDMLSECTFRTP